MTSSRSERSLSLSAETDLSIKFSGVFPASRSSMSMVSAAAEAAACAASAFSVASFRKCLITSSSELTFTCWHTILYWIRPSFARRPFLSSMHNSTYLNMICSRTFCQVRWRFDVITSWSA